MELELELELEVESARGSKDEKDEIGRNQRC
jgi:hypothetical protein